jgi:hypothetical protein
MTCLRSRQPLDFQQLLVTHGDVLGRQPGITGAQQVFAVEVLLGLDSGGIGPEQAAGVTRRYRFRPGLVEMTPGSSARLVL